jgi:hypothetical protein
MTRRTLRARIGGILIVGHFATLVLVGVLAAMDRFDPENEMFATFGVLAPLFAAYTTVAVRQLIQGQTPPNAEDSMSAAQVSLGLGLPIFLISVVVSFIFWKAFGGLKFSSLVKLLTLTEGLIGIYVGLVVEAFFGRHEQSAHLLPSPEPPKETTG